MDFWTAIARFGSLVVILTGVFKFIQWWRTPAHKLEAFVGWNAFKLPPQVETEFADQVATVKQTITKFQTEHPKQNMNDDAYYRANNLGSEVRYCLKEDLSSQLRFLYGCWFATVKNTGKKKCLDVNLRLPHAIRASVRHDREAKPRAIEITEVVHLGELSPKGECEVIAWTDKYLYNSDYASVHVTHESGFGKIRGEWRNDRFSNIMGTAVKVVGVLIFYFALLFTVVQVAFWLFTPHAQEATPTPSPSPSSRLSANYDEFVAGFRNLDGRDREQEEYLAAAVGKQITWDIPFKRASTEGDRVFVSFVSNDPGAPVDSGSVPLSQRDRIFALHRGDVIRIHGQLTKLAGRALHVQVTEFQLLRQATSPSPSPVTTQSPNE